MKVHLIDGTYELFRHHYALPQEVNQDGQQVSAVAGVVGSILGMPERGATPVAVAPDPKRASSAGATQLTVMP